MEYSALAKSYNTLQYAPQLKQVLSTFYKGTSFDHLSKYDLHQIFSDSIISNYQGEETLKFKLANLFRKKDYIAAFEVKANESRADFLVINGETKCYEVKSRIDTLTRLKKQAKDFADVFEFTTIVTDLKHLKAVEDVTMTHYGIWYFEGKNRIEYRQPLYSPYIDPKAQLGLLTKRELKSKFASDELARILSQNSEQNINQTLKDVLKERYKERWNFLCSNWNKILPIDIQFFFNSNINPDVIYS